MTELRKVTGPPSPVERHAGRIVAIVVIALLIAIVKPWGGSPDHQIPVAAASPSPTPIPTTRPTPRPRLYDFLSFGTNQPPPGWEMWPAGNLASFSFAMRVDLRPPDAVAASPEGSPSASSSATGIPVASSDEGLGTVPATWPTIRIPVGSNLDLIGLNYPRGFSVRVVSLHQVDAAKGSTAVRAIIGTSPWPDHFTIVGFAPSNGPDAMEPWQPGTYRLDLTFDPGAVSRSVEVVIEGPAPSSSSAASSASAAP
jgi:hypothetical protein